MTPHSEKKFATLRKWNRKKNYLMKALRMRLAKMVWDLKEKNEFTLASIKKILLLRDDDKIGDMVVSTSLLRELSKKGYTVDVLATPNNVAIIENNPHINNIYLTSAVDTLQKLGAERYDLIIDMGDKISPTSLRYLREVNGRNVIGFNKESYNIYNKSISYKGYNSHITERYSLLMKTLELQSFSTHYELFYPEEFKAEVTEFLNGLGFQRVILINPFAADSRREMSFEQLIPLLTSLRTLYPQTAIVLLDHLNKIDFSLPAGVFINPFQNILAAIALIANVDLIISPDTSIVHIAAAYDKPLVSLYGNDIHGKYINSDVWGPGYANAIQIRTQDKYHPVSTIEVDIIISAIQKLSPGVL